MSKESTFQKTVLKRLRQYPDCFCFVKEAGSLKGLPDLIGVMNGSFFGLEVKRSYKESMETTGRILLQKYFLEKIRSAGGFGAFIYPENMDKVIDKLYHHCHD